MRHLFLNISILLLASCAVHTPVGTVPVAVPSVDVPSSVVIVPSSQPVQVVPANKKYKHKHKWDKKKGCPPNSVREGNLCYVY